MFKDKIYFIRPINIIEEKLFLKLIDDYLSILLSKIVFTRPEEIDSLNTINRLKYQKRYCLNQKNNDKTRSILTKFFGSSWANKYIDDILFDC